MIKNFEPLKKCFINNNWNWQESEELFKCIDVKNKNNMWLYNYNDICLVDRNHPVLMKCRGLVVDTEGKILNYPFERFFNYWEKECSTIDWESACIQEKVDGSLICIFWNGNDWEITTRGSFYNIEGEERNINYAELFRKQFNKHSFNLLDKEWCFCFEIISQENRIVTWYNDERIYLIGARCIIDFKELDDVLLNGYAELLNVMRPRTFKATNINECKKLFEGFRSDEEGLVVVDDNFNRMKIKQESYIKLSRIKMLKPQDLFEYIVGLNEIDVEYLSKCPDVVKELEVIKNQWKEIMIKVTNTFINIQGLSSRKEFAMEAIKYSYKGMLFNMLDNNINYEGLKWEEVIKW